MSRLGEPFLVCPSGAPEDDVTGTPMEMARILAERKARAISAKVGELVPVLGADTVLDVDGRIVGKPTDPSHAEQMLKELRGRWHSVITALAVSSGDQCKLGAVETRVLMRHSSSSEIRRYVESGEPMDKAGAYAIQGWGGDLVESIEGCYFNVVGLPLCELVRLLREIGREVPSGICRDPEDRICPHELESPSN